MDPVRTDSTQVSHRQVVACVLIRSGKLLLFRRSQSVTWDAGLWHCVTGFLQTGRDPITQALSEVSEETALDASVLTLHSGPHRLLLTGKSDEWIVHCCAFEVIGGSLTLNWENDAAISVDRLADLPDPHVTWLPDVLDALGIATK